MNGCQTHGPSVPGYLDGELEPAERTRFESHLAGCQPCRETLESQRWLSAQLEALPHLEPSPQFEARFWARLARDGEADARNSRGWFARLRARSARLRARSPLDWAVGAVALAALALLLSSEEPRALPQEDWDIVANAEQFELLQEGDLELLAALDVLEGWDAVEEI